MLTDGHPLTRSYRVTICGCGIAERTSSQCRKLFGPWPEPIKMGECFDNVWCVLCPEQSPSWRSFVFVVSILPESLLSSLDDPLNGTPKSVNAPLCQWGTRKKEKAWTKTAEFAFVYLSWSIKGSNTSKTGHTQKDEKHRPYFWLCWEKSNNRWEVRKMEWKKDGSHTKRTK